MSLGGALNIGQSALLTSQAAIQVAGNNMANATSTGYHRQVASLAPARPDRISASAFVGTGVTLRTISRVVDTALQARLRDAVSREAGADIDRRFLSAIELLQNELTDQDLSTKLSEFFSAFSELANDPNDSAVRSVVLRQAGNVADHIRSLRSEYARVREEIDRSLDAATDKANGLMTEIAALNVQISEIEGGQGTANTLRDQRDERVSELAKLLDVSVIEQPNGAVDVLVGSLPVVLAGQSRGIELRVEAAGAGTEVSVRVAADGSTLSVESGQIGALLRQRGETVDPAIADLDSFARAFITEVNGVHSQGQGIVGWSSVVGLTKLTSATTPLNADATELPFDVRNGSYKLHITNRDTGIRESVQILVDPATMSLSDVVAAIGASGLPNVTASAVAGNSLRLDAAAGYQITFSDDSSGVLAALGVNALFGGSDATDIAINGALLDNPQLLAAARDHIPGSNGSALAMAALEHTPISSLDGQTLRGAWQASVNDLAVRVSAANDTAESSTLVRESLAAQSEAVSGVSLDEEAIDLMSFQRQFQAAARFISVIDEALQTLLSMA